MSFIGVGEEKLQPIKLFYEDYGEGNPIILIHGWPLSGRSWEKQVSVLVHAGYRVITYDRRGFGESSKPGTGYNYDTFAEDLHKMISQLDLHDAALVGFSMGTGEVVRYLGVYGSRRVRCAALISSVPPFLLKTADNPGGLDGSVFEAIKRAIVSDRPAFLSSFLADFFNVDVLGNDRVSNQAVQYSWNIAANASPKGTFDCVSAWLTDFRDDLKSIEIPTLVVHGDADRVLPIEATGIRLHEAVKGSQLMVVKGAPHGLIWTHADRLNPELLNFLGRFMSSHVRRTA